MNENKYERVLKTMFLLPFLCFFFALLVITSCSTSKLFEKQKYDKVIQQSVKKILKDENDQKSIQLLKSSFQIANKQDLDNINLLQDQNTGESWYQSIALFESIEKRNKSITPINHLLGLPIRYYTEEKKQAYNTAAMLLYQQGKALMNNPTRIDAQKAYYQFTLAKSIKPALKDIDIFIDHARESGVYQIAINYFFESSNTHNLNTYIISSRIGEMISNYSFQYLSDTKWINITPQFEGKRYDGIIDIIDYGIEVFPVEEKKTVHHFKDIIQVPLKKQQTEKKDKKNDQPAYKDKKVSAKFFKEIAEQQLVFYLNINIIGNDEIKATIPIEHQSYFKEKNYYFTGDWEALDQHSQDLLSSDKVKEYDFNDFIAYQTDQVFNYLNSKLSRLINNNFKVWNKR